jgi:hypothetical protein
MLYDQKDRRPEMKKLRPEYYDEAILLLKLIAVDLKHTKSFYAEPEYIENIVILFDHLSETSESEFKDKITSLSDKDFSTVFIPTNYDLLSLQKVEYVNDSTKSSAEDRRNTEEDIDDQQYSLSRFLNLVLHGNPNLTEILFCNNPIIELSVLISNTVYDSFTGFAISQKKKLEYKALRFKQLQASLSWFDKKRPNEILDHSAQMSEGDAVYLNALLSEYKGRKNNRESFHAGLPMKVIYEKVKEEYDRYGWRVKTDTFETRGYDVKFASHAIRLFYEGERLLTTGSLEFPITGKALDDIMSVKNGNLSIEEFYKLCDEYEERNRQAKAKSVLPDKADWKWANATLVSILEESIMAEYHLRDFGKMKGVTK